MRHEEVATRPELKHTRWLWLKNHANLSVKQQGELHRLMRPLGTAGHRPGPALAGSRDEPVRSRCKIKR